MSLWERVDDPEDANDPPTWRMRVPGGWLYRARDEGEVMAFVPAPAPSPADEPRHVCGLTGFGALGDVCPGCQRETLVGLIRRIDHAVHATPGGYDWNADPERLTLRMGEAMRYHGHAPSDPPQPERIRNHPYLQSRLARDYCRFLGCGLPQSAHERKG